MNATTSTVDGSSVAEKSPFLSVDPAAPASLSSSVDELRYFVYGPFVLYLVRLLTELN
jgi:deoxyhypusine monooxygenase